MRSGDRSFNIADPGATRSGTTHRRRHQVSELLKKGLETSQREIEAGLVDAEAELARMREQCEQLEHLIAVGKATMYAMQLKPTARNAVPEKPKMQNGRGDASEHVVKQLQSNLA
jgi:hypothetical protein